jgi:hypothetical protein
MFPDEWLKSTCASAIRLAVAANCAQGPHLYNHLFRQMLVSQFKLDRAILHAQGKAVRDVRAARQQVDETAGEDSTPAKAPALGSLNSECAADESATRTSFSCPG